MKPPLPPHEAERLKELYRYALLDTSPEQTYDDITRIASCLAGTPIALISLVDEKRQWFKSKVGLNVQETPRDQAFCAHAIINPDEALNIEDATVDERFADNPLVTGDPKIRFYFGIPLTTQNHMALGTLCVIDRQPRHLDDEQKESLAALARQATALLELRRRTIDLHKAITDQMVFMDQLLVYQKELEQAHARLQDVSAIDIKTRVGNRPAFDKRLTQEVERAQRYHASLSLMLIQIDDYEKLCVREGVEAGEQTLLSIASALGIIRPSDFLARFAEDIFAVIVPTTGVDAACSLAERIRRAVAQITFRYGPVTISIGIATLSKASGQEALIQAAERGLKAAQEAGKNRVIHADLIEAINSQTYVIL